MTLKVMYVLEKGTKVDGTAPQLPYQFSAEEREGAFKCIVNIVMPLGGSQSGLFRYPKKGEKILVGVEDNAGAFLMGYMPEDAADNIETGKDNTAVMPDEKAGQIFRYKGPNDDSKQTKEYSEIGFYNEETKWKAKGASSCPKIDTLKITSAGDINQKATNHNQIKAKRFELLVNCDGSGKTDKDSNSKFAFGDQEGDDTELYAGDAHIRAKNRIIIKAEDEIRLEVGRSAIIINDTGISIVSRRTRANISSGWDSLISLTAANGLTMSGQTVSVNAGFGLSLTEGYGGGITSKFGIVRINGFDIKLSTLTSLNYTLKGVANSVDTVFNTAFMIGGVCGSNFGPLGSLGNSISGGIRLGGRALIDMFIENFSEQFNIADTPSTLITVFTITQLILTVLSIVLEQSIPEKILREVPTARDGIYAGIAVVENGFAMAVFIALAASSYKGAVHDSTIWLNNNSSINMEAQDINLNTIDKLETNSALAALSFSKIKDLVTNNKILFGSLALVAAGGIAGLIYGGVESYPQNEAFEEELRSL